MYSILTYFAAAKTIDFLLYGIEEYQAVIVISDRHAMIKRKLIEELNRSVTIYKGQSGINNTEKDILCCVVTRLEVGEIKNAVLSIDTDAFIIIQAVSDAEGGVIKKSDFH